MNHTILYYLILTTVCVFIFIPIIKENPKWQNLILCVLLLGILHFLSLYNVFIDFLPSAELDANSFWEVASSAAKKQLSPPFYIGAQAYIVFLYWQIIATVNELQIIQLFSIIFSALNVLLITRLFLTIGGQSSKTWIVILLLCLSPSFLLHSAITLREPLQLFSILLFIYFTIRLKTLWGLYLSAFFLILAATTHQALLVYSAIILTLYSLIFICKRDKDKGYFPPHISILFGAFVIFMAYFIYHVPILSGYTLTDLSQKGILEHLLAYRQPIEQDFANTAHNITLSFDTLGSTVQTIFLNYLYYLFNPILNFKFTIEYVVVFWEALIRIIGISLLLMALIRERNTQMHLLLFVFYVSITLLWSLGTSNDGQAFRHHVLSQWLMCIYIARYCQQFFSFKTNQEY